MLATSRRSIKSSLIRARTATTFTATTLSFVIGKRRLILDVTRDSVTTTSSRLIRSSILLSALLAVISVRRSSPNLFANQLADHFHQTLGAPQNVQQFSDLFQQLLYSSSSFHAQGQSVSADADPESPVPAVRSGSIYRRVRQTQAPAIPTRSVVARTFQYRGNVAQILRLCHRCPLSLRPGSVRDGSVQ